MADVFVSYARSDKARVAPLVAAIEAKAGRYGGTRRFVPARSSTVRSPQELKIATAVLVVWTPKLGGVPLGAW